MPHQPAGLQAQPRPEPWQVNFFPSCNAPHLPSGWIGRPVVVELPEATGRGEVVLSVIEPSVSPDERVDASAVAVELVVTC